MKQVYAADYKASTSTEIRQYFLLITNKAEYYANSLDAVLKLWRKSKDASGVKDLHRIG
jgi:hypothetical protein